MVVSEKYNLKINSMESRIVIKYRVKKYLKIFSLLLLLGFLTLLTYGYFRIIPNDVKFTNVTSSSFTVSWTTRFPTKGSAFLIETSNKLPISALILGGNKFNDTRDIRVAELEATQETSNRIWSNESMSLGFENFVTEKMISNKGIYYTHHVEVKGLNPGKEYSVMVGDGLLFFNAQNFGEMEKVKTAEIPETIETPIPVYGQIRDAKNQDTPFDELELVKDGIVYLNYHDEESGERSNIFSSPLNNEGNWYIDASMAVDKEGDPFLEKYSKNITNIMGELILDLGPLGLWKKEINMNMASPVVPLVINIPGYTTDEEAFGILRKISKEDSIAVKGVSAQESGCAWIGFCSYGRYDKEKKMWVNCSGVDDILTKRKCNGNDDAQATAQEVGGTGCANGGKEGDYVYYGGQCKVCGGPDQSNYKPGWWVLADVQAKCSGNTSGSIIPAETSLGRGDCTPSELCDFTQTKKGVCSSSKVCEDTIHSCGDSSKNGKLCINSSRALSSCEFVPGTNNSVTRCKSSVATGDNNNSCTQANVLCTLGSGGKGLCESQNNGTFECKDKIVGCGVVGMYGKPCINPTTKALSTCDYIYGNSNIGTYCKDTSDLGPKGGSEDPLPPNPQQDCWEILVFGSFYRGTGDNREVCENGKWVRLRWGQGGSSSQYSGCTKEGMCGIFRVPNSRCVKDDGLIYSCQGGDLKPVEEGTSVLSATNIVNASAGTKCNEGEGRCLCTSGANRNSIINSNEYCVDVFHCNSDTVGKVCDKIDGKKCSSDYITGPSFGGGNDGNTYPCDVPFNKGANNINKNIINKTYASTSVLGSQEYIFDPQTGTISGLQEGVFVFEHMGKTYMFTVEQKDLDAGNGAISIFIDNNENGKYDEAVDTKISDLASQISVSTIKKRYSYSLKLGFNFITLPFIIDDNNSRTASRLLNTLNSVYGNHFFSIAKYDGKWKVVGQNVTQYDTNDFQLVPGQGYIIKASKDIDISIIGYPIKYDSASDNAPITLYPGWNLIGTYGTNVKKYTAKSLIQGINKFEPVDFTSDNVSRWESDVQRYDGLQITNENGMDIEYGFDFPINSFQSYFVRILQGRGNWQQELE